MAGISTTTAAAAAAITDSTAKTQTAQAEGTTPDAPLLANAAPPNDEPPTPTTPTTAAGQTQSTQSPPSADATATATNVASPTASNGTSTQTPKEPKRVSFEDPSTTENTANATSKDKTTPTLEKDVELDFVGNIDVNDDIPTEAELKKVGDLLVLDSSGQSRPFKELYTGDGVAPRQLIIFIRHFFCGNCQEYLRTLSSSITADSLLALDPPTFITVIGCGRPELIDMYIKETSCHFPVYADPTRKLYEHLGMTRTFDLGKKPEYIHSNLFLTSVQSVLQGLKTGNKALKGGDFKQVGGEFLFEDGKCVWTHRMRNTRDHEELDSLRHLLGLEAKKPPMRKRWSHGIKEEKNKDKEGGRMRSSSWGRVRAASKSKSFLDKKKGEKSGENGSADASVEATPRESQELILNNGKTV